MRKSVHSPAWLPAITAPLPIVSTHEMEAIDRGERAPTELMGARWAGWGAARDGARTLLTIAQRRSIVIASLILLALLVWRPRETGAGLLLAVTLMYTVTAAYKVWMITRGERAATRAALGADISATPAAALEVADLPLYSVLVPLFHESAVLPALLDRLLALDYPADRLEVLLLIESDDDETRAALDSFDLPTIFRPITVPPGSPRTKPRALNVGLARARGEFIVIYDAEDQPEPAQLRKAVAAFRAAPLNVVCYQARLGFYNPRRSALTRFFTLDYYVWYDLILQGLARAGAFVPLGGTSNHFRAITLRRLGGWDPYNVTEDGDLGVRLARAGLSVRMLDSVTHEEAVARPWAWVRQRSRWVKGYIQTYFVHMRNPVRLLRELGPLGFLDFQALVGGSSLALLINPIMWALTAAYFLGRGTVVDSIITALFPPVVYYPALLCLVVGNFIFFYINLYACVRGGYDDLARWMLLSPLYWLLMSAAAWVAVVSLIRDPYYWAKTAHGKASAPISAPALTPVRGAPRFALSVVIPAYNEERRLPASLAGLWRDLATSGVDAEVIVVDDGSDDTTCAIVREWMERWPELRLVERPHRGKGAAIRAGIFAAQGAYVLLADADFSMSPDQIGRFSVEELGEYDLAIGVRIGKRAQRIGEPPLRQAMSKVFNTFVRWTLLPGLRDTQCGFKCMRREVARDLALSQTRVGWGFDVEQLFIARQRHYVVREVDVIWRYAQGSHIHPVRATLSMTCDVLAVRLNGLRGVYDSSIGVPPVTQSAPQVLERAV